jgi:hypothetical protein
MDLPKPNWLIWKLLVALCVCVSSGNVCNGQEDAQRRFLSETIVLLKAGHVTDDQLGKLETLASDNSEYRQIAAQTACLLRLKRGEYPAALSALELARSNTATSPKEDSSSDTPDTLTWANQRLMLWLAMEEGQGDKANELLKSMVKSSLQIQERHVAHGRLNAQILGTLCAMAKYDTTPEGIPQATLSKAIELMSNHPRKSLALAFEDSYKRTYDQIGKIEASMREVEKLSDRDLQEKHRVLKTQFEKMQNDLQVACASHQEARTKSKEIDKLIVSVRKYAMDVRSTLENTEEPDKPKPPVEPKKPESKESKDVGGRTIRVPPSESAMNAYRQAYARFEAQLRTYPVRLAEWSQRNELRKQRLADEFAAANTRLGQLSQTERAQTQTVRELSDAEKLKQAEHDEQKLQIQGIGLAIESRTKSVKRLHSPSLYPCIDWPSEAQRLLKSLL